MSKALDKDAVNILVVDDHEDNRFMLRRRLAQEGFSQIREAENGAEALGMLNREQVDLMLLDLMMPIMDGFQVLEQMNKDGTIRDIPVIMISADHNTENVVKGIELGAVDYLPKPFDKALLRARINATIEKKRLADFERSFLAHHDQETGLPNRKRFASQIDAAFELPHDQEVLAVCAFAVPSINEVGASMGSQARQALSDQIVDTLQSAVEAQGDPVARISEEHFAILLRNEATQWEAIERISEICNSLRAEFTFNGNTVTPALKMGMSFRNAETDGSQAMLSEAEIALERADRNADPPIQVFDPEMQKHMAESLTLQTRIRKAIENGELELYYQPFLALHAGRITGAEALIRWNCPEEGLVSPAKFIPVAEETGLIIPMGEWIVEEGYRQAAEWNNGRRKGQEITINLNIAALQFSESDLIGQVEKCIATHGEQPIKFEVTETAIMSRPEQTRDILQRLKQMGIRHAMDDFGTGYSSLSHLHQFPFDTLKIDQSFIRRLTEDTSAREIVRATIAMAHALALDVVAEGIETSEEMSLLMEYDCDYAQGYFFGKPMPAPEFAAMLKSAGTT